jgi:hypothetical protein
MNRKIESTDSSKLKKVSERITQESTKKVMKKAQKVKKIKFINRTKETKTDSLNITQHIEVGHSRTNPQS